MTTKSQQRRFITVAEILDELDIARSTWDGWKAKGHIPAHIKLPSGKLRIKRTDYVQWLEMLKSKAAC
jgi:predicted DNA-binding transcriptional regulator AlpA